MIIVRSSKFNMNYYLTTKIVCALGREVVRKDSRSRSPRQHPENRPPSSSSLSSNQESTKHQHQHQHIHQHQHSHQHQHFHPPFGMVPNGVFPPSVCPIQLYFVVILV